METIKFRKHPGGAGGFINTLKILLFLSLIGHAIGLVISFVCLFVQKIGIQVVGRLSGKSQMVNSDHALSYVKETGELSFEPRNVLEWLFLPRGIFDFYSIALSFLIVIYAYRIFREINFLQPFYDKISKLIVRLYQIMFFGYIFLALKSIYILYVVRGFNEGKYKVNFDIGLTGYVSLTTIMIVYIIAHVYKKGVVLQKEQDLVI